MTTALAHLSQMSHMEKLNKQQAADYLGMSVRTLLRLTSEKIAHLPKRRQSEETIFDKAELDRYQRESQIGASVMSAVVIPDTRDTHGIPSENQDLMQRRAGMSISPVTLDTGDTRDTPEMRLRMLAAFEAMASPARLSEKLTLTLTEAALLSGLSRGHLRQAIEEKKLKARIIGRGWRVKRADLDAYVTKL